MAATATKKVKFISRCPNQVLCITPSDRQFQNGFSMKIQGRHIRFEKGEYETADADEIKFIRGHDLFGGSIFEDKATAETTE